ncbi:MAG: hypothetical protein EOO88_00300 [Pedobacter sp.]|nr:MAG: hypothetical protein EOO88_00300 [Pedobacter sp.]
MASTIQKHPLPAMVTLDDKLIGQQTHLGLSAPNGAATICIRKSANTFTLKNSETISVYLGLD